DAFISALPAAGKVTVLTQKYLAFYNQAYQAWAEYRRTGEPGFLLKPGEQTSVGTDGTPIMFIPLLSYTITDLPRRLTYPQQEFTVNGTNASAAAAAVGVGGDKMTTQLFWQLPQAK
ncbi:MAG: SusD/RagB family nutrient-binding outer membrane lipoprotein, partial [Bacteroidetes bacterium]|nr:SusD/RagB family nutrient-binding outer membrane lipoprotein [Bacteroidota bacterium]